MALKTRLPNVPNLLTGEEAWQLDTGETVAIGFVRVPSPDYDNFVAFKHWARMIDPLTGATITDAEGIAYRCPAKTLSVALAGLAETPELLDTNVRDAKEDAARRLRNVIAARAAIRAAPLDSRA